MADDRRKQLNRRAVLKGAMLLAGLAAIPLTVEAAGTASKASMQYQDHPKGNQDCSTCLQFIPGKSASAMGQCNVVAGPISPKGWCIAYAKKS